MRHRPERIEPEEAEGLAAEALGFIASDPVFLPRFLALTGIEAAEIRQAASEPGFLIAVLDFLLAHPPTLQEFCEASNHRPERVAAAREKLPGASDAYDRSI